MARIDYLNDQNGSVQEAHGSDGRVNVSARADSRAYYNSRDAGQTYSFVWNFDAASDGEFAAYLKNDSTSGKTLVVEEIGLNSEVDTRFKLHFATGAASAGNEITPVNLNRGSSNAATATAREGGQELTGVAVGGVDGLIDMAYCPALGHEEFRLQDRLRLGQNDAIVLEVDELTDGDVSGVIFFYFE